MDLALEKPATESMTSALYRQLKHNLMIGRLKPGDSLTLKSLSESTGLSQTPVREALLRLVSERLLELVHGRSVTVPVLTLETFIELREIRIRLETLAIERASPNITDKDIETIERIHRRYMQHRKRADYAGVLSANIDFHLTIYRAANMPNLVAMIENLWARIGPYGGFMYKTPVTEHVDGHPHDRIMAALAMRDTKTAIEGIIEDVQRHGDRMISYLQVEHLFDQPQKERARSESSPSSNKDTGLNSNRPGPRKRIEN
jgi:DNA-binding GntR family transcriptional regulator